eukprot:2185687-Pyramimonas_sp.AAC.1
MSPFIDSSRDVLETLGLTLYRAISDTCRNMWCVASSALQLPPRGYNATCRGVLAASRSHRLDVGACL